MAFRPIQLASKLAVVTLLTCSKVSFAASVSQADTRDFRIEKPGSSAFPGDKSILPWSNETNDAPASVTTSYLLAWEGRDVSDYNLEALRLFRREHPSIRLTHFISPAYFLRQPDLAAKTKEAILSLMLPGDHVGLLIGGWKSLLTAAGVNFRYAPTFWGHVVRPLDCPSEVYEKNTETLNRPNDCGLEIPLHVYSDYELTRIIATGLDTLAQQGFGQTKALMVEGWVASPQVLEAAAKQGIRYDFSGVASELLIRRTFYYPLFAWVKSLWPNITPHTQPYTINTASGSILELPQNIAAADYLLPDDIQSVFKEYLERASKDKKTNLSFQIGLYQETAARILPLFSKTVTQLESLASAGRVELKSFVMPTSVPPTAVPVSPPTTEGFSAQPLAH